MYIEYIFVKKIQGFYTKVFSVCINFTLSSFCHENKSFNIRYVLLAIPSFRDLFFILDFNILKPDFNNVLKFIFTISFISQIFLFFHFSFVFSFFLGRKAFVKS